MAQANGGTSRNWRRLGIQRKGYVRVVPSSPSRSLALLSSPPPSFPLPQPSSSPSSRSPLVSSSTSKQALFVESKQTAVRVARSCSHSSVEVQLDVVRTSQAGLSSIFTAMKSCLANRLRRRSTLFVKKRGRSRDDPTSRRDATSRDHHHPSFPPGARLRLNPPRSLGRSTTHTSPSFLPSPSFQIIFFTLVVSVALLNWTVCRRFRSLFGPLIAPTFTLNGTYKWLYPSSPSS